VSTFDEFFIANYDSVLRAMRAVVTNADRAEESTQEAFARALRRWRHVATMDRPVTWVYVVALNDERRRWRRERDGPTLPLVLEPEPDVAARIVTSLRLREAVMALPGRQRAAVVLRYFSDLTVADVAEAMGCAPGTVKATLHHALRQLKITLDEEDDDDAG
jgi:RNA polymerase sigma-70 factor (ECF subfamily)